MEPDIDAVLADREVFNEFIYTPWQDAVAAIESRAGNTDLDAYVARMLPAGIPEAMKGKKSIVLFRHIATSNHEISRFAICADALDTFQPLILEYTEDKFNDRNEWKYFLGKLRFHKGLSKSGEPIFEHVNIINFNESNNKPMSSLLTNWGQPFVEFHHELFDHHFPHMKDNVHDLSTWLHELGPTARDYYKGFFTLFLKDAILFENFMVDAKERSFTEEIILPAFFEIYKETGLKPLIVALEPTEMESDQFWLSHPYAAKELLVRKQA